MTTFENVHRRFWPNVKIGMPGGCWEWIGAKSKPWRGRLSYGYFRFYGHQTKAHRVAYRLVKGVIPNGMYVLHRCDNPPCVRPDHLFLGTLKDNMADCREKGRKRYAYKLTPEQILEIRQRYTPRKISQRMLAKEYNVNPLTIFKILKRKTYREFTEERRN